MTEGTASVVSGLVHVRQRGGGTELWPQVVENPVSRQSMPWGEREELHEITGPALRPRRRRDGLAVHAHLEPAEQGDVDVLDPSIISGTYNRRVGMYQADSPAPAQ
jgi:hypothetical protein